MAKKILIVDDEPEIVKLIQTRLTHRGYEVLSAKDGMEGLAHARHHIPDLIILDVMLPKLDGFAVCHMLKYDERYQKIPIILLTSRIQESDKETGKNQKADAYLTKPYQPKELFETIERLLKPDLI